MITDLSAAVSLQVAYATNLASREENWRAKLPGYTVIAEHLSVRLRQKKQALQAQRVQGKMELINMYKMEPIHCVTPKKSTTGVFGPDCLVLCSCRMP